MLAQVIIITDLIKTPKKVYKIKVKIFLTDTN